MSGISSLNDSNHLFENICYGYCYLYFVFFFGIQFASSNGMMDEKRLLLSDPTHFENEIRQLKSFVSSLQSTLSALVFHSTFGITLLGSFLFFAEVVMYILYTQYLRNFESYSFVNQICNRELFCVSLNPI